MIPKYGTYTKISAELFASLEKKQLEMLLKVRKEKKAGERPSGRQLFESKTAKETRELEEDEEVIQIGDYMDGSHIEEEKEDNLVRKGDTSKGILQLLAEVEY